MANWICIIDGAEVGPLSPTQLRGLVSAGKVMPETMLKKTDMRHFVKAGSVKGLLPEAVASPPSPDTVKRQADSKDSRLVAPIAERGPDAHGRISVTNPRARLLSSAQLWLCGSGLFLSGLILGIVSMCSVTSNHASAPTELHSPSITAEVAGTPTTSHMPLSSAKTGLITADTSNTDKADKDEMASVEAWCGEFYKSLGRQFYHTSIRNQRPPDTPSLVEQVKVKRIELYTYDQHKYAYVAAERKYNGVLGVAHLILRKEDQEWYRMDTDVAAQALRKVIVDQGWSAESERLAQVLLIQDPRLFTSLDARQAAAQALRSEVSMPVMPWEFAIGVPSISFAGPQPKLIVPFTRAESIKGKIKGLVTTYDSNNRTVTIDRVALETPTVEIPVHYYNFKDDGSYTLTVEIGDIRWTTTLLVQFPSWNDYLTITAKGEMVNARTDSGDLFPFPGLTFRILSTASQRLDRAVLRITWYKADANTGAMTPINVATVFCNELSTEVPTEKTVTCDKTWRNAAEECYVKIEIELAERKQTIVKQALWAIFAKNADLSQMPISR